MSKPAIPPVEYSWKELWSQEALRSAFTTTILKPWITQCRWFSGKGSIIKNICIEKATAFESENIQSIMLFVKVVFENQSQEIFFVPLANADSIVLAEIVKHNPQVVLCTSNDAGVNTGIVDALFHPSFNMRFFNAMVKGDQIETPELHVSFHTGSSFTAQPLDNEISTRVLKVEQSNSSFVVNEKYFIKLFRRLKYGVNPEYEVIRFLSEHSSFRNIPVYLGSAMLNDATGETLLALMQPLVKNNGDAWSYVKGLLLNNGSRYPVFLMQDFRENASYRALNSLTGLIGIRTAQMHLALAGGSVNTGFGITTWTTHDAESWFTGFDRLCDQLIGLVESNRDTLDARSLIDSIRLLQTYTHEHREILEGIPAIRIHGDYHLGQVLICDEELCVLDFEGEPDRSIGERRSHYPVWKDIAGMLRSFSYAVYASMIETNSALEPSAHEQALKMVHHLSDVCLKEYIRHSNLTHVNSGSSRQILQLFIAEKLLYELRYEINNRKDWALIPIMGLQDLIHEMQRLNA